MSLLLAHPEVAYRSCKECAQWLFDDQSGQKLVRNGEPMRRPKGAPTPCWQCPKGSPTAGKELSDKNRRAYEHYQECRAIGAFPDDPLVKRNARLIRAIEDRYEKAEREALLALAKRK